MTDLVLGTCKKNTYPHYKQHDCDDWVPNDSRGLREEAEREHILYTPGNPEPMGVCNGAPYAQHPKKSTCVNWRPVTVAPEEAHKEMVASQALARERSAAPSTKVLGHCNLTDREHTRANTCINWRPTDPTPASPLDKAAQFLVDRGLASVHRNGNRWGWAPTGTYPDGEYFPTLTASVYGKLAQLYEETRAAQRNHETLVSDIKAEADTILALLKQERTE